MRDRNLDNAPAGKMRHKRREERYEAIILLPRSGIYSESIKALRYLAICLSEEMYVVMWRCGLLPSRRTIMNLSDAVSTTEPSQAVSYSMEYN